MNEKIKELRKMKGWSILELSIKSNVSKSYLSGIENGTLKNPTIKFLMKVSRALDVSLDYLVNDKSKMTDIDSQDSFLRQFNRLSESDKNRIKQIITLWTEEAPINEQ